MRNRLAEVLACKPTLLADGAMGTNLFARGLQTGGCPEFWNIDHPDRVLAAHREFAAAGSDILLTNSFGGNRCRQKLHDAQDRVHELNVAAARLARQAADESGRTVVVGGSMGPTGELFLPLGPLTHDDGAAVFAEQARALAEGGADVLWIETMSSREEVVAAVAGAAAVGLPIVVTMTFDTNGCTMMGLTPADAVALYQGLPVAPIAFGANCGNGAGELVAAALGIAAAAKPGDVIVAKGNCGVPQYLEGHIHYSGTPEVMASYALMCRDAGARIIGGCCGSTAVHIRAMVDALATGARREPPTLAEVDTVFGLHRPVAGPGAVRAGRRGPRGQERRSAGG
ncbi:MAG: betaine--homocysteine S-methyltransferase [Alphaproteobacteria bacterium]|nr:betaine--homocysteine S-methyltransferase [Alphaproteobacteria bacterium]